MPAFYGSPGGVAAGGCASPGGVAAGGYGSHGGVAAGGYASPGGVVGGGGGVIGGGGGVGGGAGGGAACGTAACGCEVAAGPSSMSYVGGNAGSYILETTYKYVGVGSGEFDLVTPKRTNMCIFIGGGVGLLALLVALLILLAPGPTTTTTPPTTALPFDCNAGLGNLAGWSPEKQDFCCKQEGKGCTTQPPTTQLPYDCSVGVESSWSAPKKAWCCTNGGKGCALPPKICLLWGDPHIISFDQVGTNKNEALSFYGDGDYYVVKSDTVIIQGRFEGTKYTEGLAATNQIVVGGPFLHGHKIEVGTRDSGVLTVDGQPVMSSFPGSYAGAGFTLKYSAQGQVPDVIPEGNEKRIVSMELPLGVKVRVYQWDNYLDVEVEMSAQPNQDGVCGNFNGNHADDTTQAIIQRVGARVRPTSDLLSGQALIEFTPQMQKMMQAECSTTTQTSAQSQCAASLGVAPTSMIVKSCMFDECFGMNVRARSHAKTYA